MNDPINFIAIGKIPGECIFVHKEDVKYLWMAGFSKIIKCIAIDFVSKKVSEPISITDILYICPHDKITSYGERRVIEDLVIEVLSKEQIKELNEQFEQIKYQG